MPQCRSQWSSRLATVKETSSRLSFYHCVLCIYPQLCIPTASQPLASSQLRKYLLCDADVCYPVWENTTVFASYLGERNNLIHLTKFAKLERIQQSVPSSLLPSCQQGTLSGRRCTTFPTSCGQFPPDQLVRPFLFSAVCKFVDDEKHKQR